MKNGDLLEILIQYEDRAAPNLAAFD